MIKSFLILLTFSSLLFSSQQIVLVIADNMDTQKAKILAFEGGKQVLSTIDVNIGKKGLGWGIGEKNITHKKGDFLKFEGDKKAPSGIFKLTAIFGYSQNNTYKMPYLHASKNLICVDDSDSKDYNKIITMPQRKPKSFEYMRRDDHQYELGVVVAHNEEAIKRRGSCIFLHVQKAKDAGTAGCTSMKIEDLQKVVNWLDIKKNPLLIQVPESSLDEVVKLYPELKGSIN